MRPGLSRASGVVPSLLLFVFLCGSCAETPTRDSAASLVSTPTNVEIKSYNLNPEVFWDYQITSPTPTFTVQLKKYPTDDWNEVCTNISHHICNIFDHIENPHIAYWARVKATVGQNESSFVESKAFYMYEHGKIGPPTLKIQEINHKLIIDIDHPLIIVEGEKKGTVCDYYYYEDDDDDYCSTLTYRVYLKINGRKITEEETDAQSCNETQCQLIKQVTSFNSEYCVSAKGFSPKTSWTIKSEESEEQCITISSNKKEDSSLPILITVVCVALVMSVLFIVTSWVCKTKVLQKNTLTLPKSLWVSVKRNFPHNTLEVNSESRYISVLETSHLPVTENEENTINHLTPISSINSEDNREKSEHFQEISSITEEMTVEENITEKTSDRNQSLTMEKNYFHSNSNQVESGSLILNFCLPTDESENKHVESCNFKSDPELPQSDPEIKADIQDSITLTVNTSFGYDKPHVLVDMLTDSSDKESLIGYRPSEPFMEIS
ncbi:interferon gamma receptor 1 isoform X2 [Sminthopsis crassicaudata]|uniref:interferon gamma receptor 1 isoform X2 n=1 Tax=Sminthopsis crassicaudata TaxID=9301 RepID=UPI003D694D5D